MNFDSFWEKIVLARKNHSDEKKKKKTFELEYTLKKGFIVSEEKYTEMNIQSRISLQDLNDTLKAINIKCEEFRKEVNEMKLKIEDYIIEGHDGAYTAFIVIFCFIVSMGVLLFIFMAIDGCREGRNKKKKAEIKSLQVRFHEDVTILASEQDKVLLVKGIEMFVGHSKDSIHKFFLGGSTQINFWIYEDVEAVGKLVYQIGHRTIKLAPNPLSEVEKDKLLALLFKALADSQGLWELSAEKVENVIIGKEIIAKDLAVEISMLKDDSDTEITENFEASIVRSWAECKTRFSEPATHKMQIANNEQKSSCNHSSNVVKDTMIEVGKDLTLDITKKMLGF